jgi:hypothetical protein
MELVEGLVARGIDSIESLPVDGASSLPALVMKTDS